MLSTWITLFQLNAKQNAEKRYHEVLKKEGLQEQDLVRLTKPMQKRRRVKTLLGVHPPRKKSSRESAVAAAAGLGSDYDYDGRTSIHSRLTRTNSISLGSEYGEGSELSSHHNFD